MLTIRGSLSDLTIYLLALIFVDNTDLFTFAYVNELILDTAIRLQHMILVWRGALLQSGGKLRAEKCYWYAIYYIWISRIWYYTIKLI